MTDFGKRVFVEMGKPTILLEKGARSDYLSTIDQAPGERTEGVRVNPAVRASFSEW